ncbi:Putative aliphatic sulfonates transport permease protein SsuC [Planctopirus ephydatiae]|uniref:Aliphatic sulfonates transport permease protein SsuC n=1 Tax=Planctopirus ephydatiae TaxID=2528019 RepID=A0A518GSW8_9PLAN|nr:ABC transporter permease [Planctopirus ephydatiae]QDV31681.1 Putative aliphatic sulfonates transport permease protein SsuC [Planctopirus ephydatiae]
MVTGPATAVSTTASQWGSYFLRTIVPPLVLFVIVLMAWDGAVRFWGIKPYILPGPWRVLSAILSSREELTKAFLLTGGSAVAGFSLSVMVGTLVGCLFSQSTIIRSSGYPYAIFLQTVPIIAVAPLIILWFGRGFGGVVAVAFVISLFPMIANATAGMVQIDPDLFDLFKLNDASRWQILFKLRLPNSVPSLCTGARTSSGLAVVGAIVGEFYAGYGSKHFGLGYIIRLTTDQAKTDALFAAVMVSTLLGILIFGVVSLISLTVLARWAPPEVGERA